MSLSTVMALKLPLTPLSSSACSASAPIGGVGEDEGEHRRHVRRDHARALGDAADRHFDAGDRRRPGRELRKGVGGHDGAAASSQPSGRASCASFSSTPSNLCASSGSPMTPVDARKIWRSGAPVAAAASFAENLTACAPVLPVKALALPELTSSARALPPLSRSRHQSTGAEGHLDLVKTPATVVPAIEQRQHHIGASGVAHARGADGEAHALERRDFGRGFRRERRDGGVVSHCGALQIGVDLRGFDPARRSRVKAVAGVRT